MPVFVQWAAFRGSLTQIIATWRRSPGFACRQAAESGRGRDPGTNMGFAASRWAGRKNRPRSSFGETDARIAWYF